MPKIKMQQYQRLRDEGALEIENGKLVANRKSNGTHKIHTEQIQLCETRQSSKTNLYHQKS
jgi:hypothetical protein